MRLHPAVGMPLQRVAPDGGDVIGGQFYEAGTLVSMSAYEVHFDERAYGTDAAEWRPERWLDGDRVVLERFNLAVSSSSVKAINMILIPPVSLAKAVASASDATDRKSVV